ncbi:hypothetical protein MUG84_02180 [Paenibacillus sp. KQZ6P-2]|uniref:DUF4825 domain-containing protein n=1 Tax=Paenibacillus mangrovi TaxID=2931978 RepID=A0A9X2B3Z1_9BACL|nr:hypothetical protein [Paenibacillus mangrovi]MCJ8010548.1 hypothetical protein [Paenibacillus mangrovi]
MQPRSPLKVICMMIAACLLLASCSRNTDPAKVNAAQKKDVWSNAEVTRENVKQVLVDVSGEGVMNVAQAKDIQLQGANNKTVTVDLKHDAASPDQWMMDAANTLLAYSQILFENDGIGTVEVCLYGNPDPANGKNTSKELVRIAVNRVDWKKGEAAMKTPVENYADVFKHASWYKIHPHLYKSLQHKDQLKMKAYQK